METNDQGLSIDSPNLFFEKAPVGYLVLDKRGIILQVNEKICQLLKCDESELIDCSLSDFIYQEDLPVYNKNYNSFYRKPTEQKLELRLTKDNETFRYCQLIGSKVKLPISEIKNKDVLLVSVIDITDVYTQRQESESSVKLLKFAIAQMPIPVMITGVAGTSKPLYNQLASDLVHYRSNLVGETILPGNYKILPMLLPDRSQIKTKDLPLSKAISQGISTHNQDIIIPHPEGDRRISASAEPLRDEQGNIIAGIVVFPEITDRIELKPSCVKISNY